MDDDTSKGPAGDDAIGEPAPQATESASRPSGEDADQAAKAAPAKPRGRVLGGLGLLLALAALCGVGYLYYLLVFLGSSDELDARLGRLEASLPEIRRDLAAGRDAQAEEIESAVAAQQASLDETRRALLGALNEVTAAAAPAPREWKIAEVEYLLRIANHRVLMEGDVEAALQLMGAADVILEELDDFAYFQVRAQLADEMLALKGVRGSDLQGVYLRLEAMKTSIGELPVRLPDYFRPASSADASAEAEGFWSALAAELSGYFQLRRFDGATKPLMAPEENAYLELNLRLAMERAQLAVLRRNQLVFERSLSSAREWILEFLDPDDPGVQQVAEELDALSALKLERDLPDVSGSLTALLELRRGNS
jgi:uroporphyrin-3 C-methyltransferase